MRDPDVQREQRIADEWLEAWTEAQLDKLWAAYADELPWNDAGSKEETMSSETTVQPLRLALEGIPERCGNCGETSEAWPLTVFGHQVSASCPRCFTVVAPVVAVAAGAASHEGCATIAEHRQLQDQVARLLEQVTLLAEAVNRHGHSEYGA